MEIHLNKYITTTTSTKPPSPSYISLTCEHCISGVFSSKKNDNPLFFVSRKATPNAAYESTKLIGSGCFCRTMSDLVRKKAKLCIRVFIVLTAKTGIKSYGL